MLCFKLPFITTMGSGFDGSSHRLGRPCLYRSAMRHALFGDQDCPRPFQKQLKIKKLGPLQFWDGLWPMIDRLRMQIARIPDGRDSAREWTLK